MTEPSIVRPAGLPTPSSPAAHAVLDYAVAATFAASGRGLADVSAPRRSVAGALAGIGALAIPGVGPFIAAGPTMGALANLGVGGAVGGLVGALIGMGVPEYEGKRYEGRLKEGGVLLSANCDTSEEVTRAKNILKRTRATDVDSAGEEAVGATVKPVSTRTHSKSCHMNAIQSVGVSCKIIRISG